MARVHVLRGQDRVFSFTLDEQGTNLPRQYEPWSAFNTIELHHDEPYRGVDVSVCLDDISKHGFHLTAAHKRITHLAVGSVPVMSARALVLGGGGAAGNAWGIGVIAGLFEAGLDVTEADLIIGTSAGSTAAVQITSAPPTQLLAEILSAAPPQRTGPTRADGGPVPIGPAANHMEIICAVEWVRRRSKSMRPRTAPGKFSGALPSPLGCPVSSGRNGGCSYRRSMPIPASRSSSTATAASTWWTPSPPALPTASVFLRTASATGDTSTAATEETRMPIWQAGTHGCSSYHHSAADHCTRWTGAPISQHRPTNYAQAAAESKPSSRIATLKT